MRSRTVCGSASHPITRFQDHKSRIPVLPRCYFPRYTFFSMQDSILSVRGLVKTYPGKPPVEAVRGIDLDVRTGETFGLLGPNGAGKSTTIAVVTTRAIPNSGAITVAGVDVVAAAAESRVNMGVVTQFNTLDRQLSVFDNIYYHCRYFGWSDDRSKKRTSELLELFRLSERGKTPVVALSGGLAQRVQIARAIAHQPKVLFLDEPSAGLDPQSRLALWDVIRELRNQGITVVLTTHYMEEADALCQRVAIIDHGKILVCDTPAQLKAQVGSQKVINVYLQSDGAREALLPSFAQSPGVTAAEPIAHGVRIFAPSSQGLLPRIVELAGPHLRDISIQETTLETVFIKLTGRDLRD